MTIFVIPVGVVAAVYLSEYSRQHSLTTRIIRNAVSNLAGVPSIVFGLFGLGFFIAYVGSGIDSVLLGENHKPVWGRPALIWASLTMAVMTLPVVIVATEESLNAIPQDLRDAGLALGASKTQTVLHILLPQALPGILTGASLSVSRAAGEGAPLLFTGAAYFMADFPHSLTDQFMDLGYQIYILSTQSTSIAETHSLLYATVLILLFLTFALNITAVLVRMKMRRQIQALRQ
jgi:phosphate transport system permease protein